MYKFISWKESLIEIYGIQYITVLKNCLLFTFIAYFEHFLILEKHNFK